MAEVAGLYGRFGVRIPPFGSGWVSVRCFTGRHPDRHPSARVNAGNGCYRCFTCAVGGGVLEALQLLGVDLQEAVRLAVEYGILEERPQRHPRPALPGIAYRAIAAVEAPAGNSTPLDYDTPPVRVGVAQERSWRYDDADGNPVGRVRRLDLTDGQKRIWQERPDGDGWAAGLNGTLLPLYRLPAVLEHAKRGERIIIVEGEKAVDGLERIGLFATTNAGGAGKWRLQHTEALRRAQVVAIADCDLPGREHALSLTGELVGAGVRCAMPVELDAERDDGYDIYDHLMLQARRVRADDPALEVDAVRERLRNHVEQLLRGSPPATFEALGRRQELDRHRGGHHMPGTTAILDCRRCNTLRVHRLAAGLAYCPCGAHRAP